MEGIQASSVVFDDTTQHINQVKCGIFVVVVFLNQFGVAEQCCEMENEEWVAKHMSEMIQLLIVAHVFEFLAEVCVLQTLQDPGLA